MLTELCLTFGVPRVIRCDGGKTFGAEVVTNLCRWLHAEIIVFGPADHPRGQGAVERLRGYLQELLAELCRSWPERWDEYVSPAIWIQRTLPDVSLSSHMTPFELLFGRRPRTSLDTLVPLADETGQSGGLDNFVERRKQNLREVRLALEKRHNQRVTARAHANATISRPSAGALVEKGSLVLVCESESSRHRDNRGRKLQHDHYTGPWKVTEVVQAGISIQVTMRGRKQRTRTVSVADVKPFHLRPLTLRHSLADEFAQYAWGPDFKVSLHAVDSASFDSLVSCRRSISPLGSARWEYKGTSREGVESGWLAENEILKSFTPLQLDGFIALWHLYNQQSTNDSGPASVKHRAPLSRREALTRFPIGFTIWKDFIDGLQLQGQVYDYRDRYW